MLDNESIKLGEILENLRRRNRLNQEELAFRSGIDSRFLSDVERDVSKPGLITFMNLAIALKMMPSDLMKLIEIKHDIIKEINKNDDLE